MCTEASPVFTERPLHSGFAEQCRSRQIATHRHQILSKLWQCKQLISKTNTLRQLVFTLHTLRMHYTSTQQRHKGEIGQVLFKMPLVFALQQNNFPPRAN